VYSPVLPEKDIEIEVAHQSAGCEEASSPLTDRDDEKLRPRVSIIEKPFYYSLDEPDLPIGMCMHK